MGAAIFIPFLLGPARNFLAVVLDQELRQETRARVGLGVGRGMSHRQKFTQRPVAPAEGAKAQIDGRDQLNQVSQLAIDAPRGRGLGAAGAAPLSARCVASAAVAVAAGCSSAPESPVSMRIACIWSSVCT